MADLMSQVSSVDRYARASLYAESHCTHSSTQKVIPCHACLLATLQTMQILGSTSSTGPELDYNAVSGPSVSGQGTAEAGSTDETKAAKSPLKPEPALQEQESEVDLLGGASSPAPGVCCLPDSQTSVSLPCIPGRQVKPVMSQGCPL